MQLLRSPMDVRRPTLLKIRCSGNTFRGVHQTLVLLPNLGVNMGVTPHLGVLTWSVISHLMGAG